jgi:hypothetical protein
VDVIISNRRKVEVVLHITVSRLRIQSEPDTARQSEINRSVLILYSDGVERRSMGQLHGSITIRDICTALDAIKGYVFILCLEHYRA